MRDGDELDPTGIPMSDLRKPRPTDRFPDVGYVRYMVDLLSRGGVK